MFSFLHNNRINSYGGVLKPFYFKNQLAMVFLKSSGREETDITVKTILWDNKSLISSWRITCCFRNVVYQIYATKIK